MTERDDVEDCNAAQTKLAWKTPHWREIPASEAKLGFNGTGTDNSQYS